MNSQNALPTLFLPKEKKKITSGFESHDNENINENRNENKNEIENGCNTEIESDKYLVK